MKQRIHVAALLAMAALALVARRSEANPAHHPPPGAAPAMGSAAAPPAMGSAAPAAMGSPAMGSPAMGSPAAGSAAASPGMGEMMEMMGSMGPSAAGGCMGGDCGGGAGGLPLYPSLMTLPSLTPEHRAAIYALASRQVDEGMARLAKGSEALAVATHAGDNAASQEAVAAMRGGLAELDAGLAARRVLLEGKAPRNLALAWFKREMNLAAPTLGPQPAGRGGVRPLHVLTMVLLVGFAAAMVAMYFFKMRRASALFRRLEGDRGAPPPGSAPPLAGASKPDGGAKPAADAAKPAADAAKPAADSAKPAAGAATRTPAEQNPLPEKAPASAETSPSRTGLP